jgi:alkylation response protein AidB-like acyl-CoA dehydrogenase
VVLTKTQLEIVHAVRAYAQEKIRPQSRAFEAAAGFPPELFVELGEMGLMALTAPESVGGAGADYVSYALALMEIAAADGALSTILSIQNSLMVSGLLRYGTPPQIERFLPDLISGRAIGAFALTEASAGSDAAAIRTRAARVSGGWRLDGDKQFITSGKIAKLILLFAVTDPSAGKRGVTCFLLPAARDGFSVERVETKLGQRASDTCALRFSEVFVEDDLVLGEVGNGYRMALANLEVGRIGIAAQSVGMAQAALDIAIAYARDRKSMGKPIIAHQAVGFRLADLATKNEAARQLVLHAASKKDAGEDCLTEASMCKLFAASVAEEVVSGALQTLGGYGYLEDYEIAKIYRDVRVSQIYEGTSDILRMVISRRLASGAPR